MIVNSQVPFMLVTPVGYHWRAHLPGDPTRRRSSAVPLLGNRGAIGVQQEGELLHFAQGTKWTSQAGRHCPLRKVNHPIFSR